MTYDLIANFREKFKDNKIVLDTYKLDDGYYYLFKKDGTLNRLIVQNDESDDYDLYKYFKIRDICSKYLNSNKALDTGYTEQIGNKKYNMLKKICSDNIYTLFFKNKYLDGLCKGQDSTEAVPIEIFKEGINKYYESLEKLGTDKNDKILLEEGYKHDEIEFNKARMLKAFQRVYEDLKNEEIKKETWIKIFLEENEEEYLRVSNFYLVLKLFNTNDNNTNFEDEVYGVNNYNFGLNSKKPFLELKSTPYKVSSLVTKDDINILNNIYMWLYNNALKESVLRLPGDWDFNGVIEKASDAANKDVYLIKVAGNNGVARIDDFQYVSNFSSNISSFYVKDVLRKVKDDFKIDNIYYLEYYTSNTWIANGKSEKNYLKDAYYDYDGKISKSAALSNWKKDFLRYNAGIFFELFQKEDENSFVKNLDKIGEIIIGNTLIDDLEKDKKRLPYSSIKSMNLWIAYKTYFSKEGEVSEEMKINNVEKECKDILLNCKKIETDEQYYYLAGQVAFYLLKQSKASKLTQDVTAPIIKASSVKRLKEEIRFLHEKYGYDIYLNNSKFNNVMSQLLLQQPETDLKKNKDLVLAGMLANNMFYDKKEDENGGNEDGEDE